MKRKALLIAGVKKSEFSPASKNDVSFIRCFLTTRNWQEDEIKTLIDPTTEELLYALNYKGEGFRFIFYSGHGCISRNTQYILIENKLLNIAHLISKVPSEIAIFNCCRDFATRSDLEKAHEFLECDFNFERYYEKINIATTELKELNFIAFTTKTGSTSKKLHNNSCFIHLFSKILKKIEHLKYAGWIPLNTLLYLVSIAFKRSTPAQEFEYYIKSNID